ncbi:SDR family NAD(P)-dependent oxidoreductase [Qipengyuania marisflavi]|uniref:SDR family NAD(P)-dependent oxidoreductase n=1 Tax=Qipengyuania marisflavi TaxID=2486356 RepID=A0A5S3P509_9SPHN|nr:SDR family NAD(P)-dependent oxidoreductase [Qipengyuania marisflavi]TMM48034.1 SDR family NAD(P)-dependent oxidoreductase [Qipengyuania marisflavi]
MADKTILIIGASRGIGLGLTREFGGRGWRVIASERSRSADLHALSEGKDVTVITVDMSDPASFTGLDLADGSLDAIVLNAGITGAQHQSAEKATADEVATVMMTNAFGPAHAAKALLPKLKHGGSLGFMSSLMGSIDDSSGGYDLYRTSKAAQNMLAKGIAEQDAAARDIAVLSLHPGWVQTDMGGPNAKITVQESCKGMADVIEQSGGAGYRYLDYTGKELAF